MGHSLFGDLNSIIRRWRRSRVALFAALAACVVFIPADRASREPASPNQPAQDNHKAEPRAPGATDKGNTISATSSQISIDPGGHPASPLRFGTKRNVAAPRSIEPLDAPFNAAAPGTIEASFDPPIEGILRIVIRAGIANSQPQSGTPAGEHAAQGADQPFVLEVTQSGRLIPFRLVGEGGRRNTGADKPSLLIADIDVNDLTPGVPVRITVHSNLTDPPDLVGNAYQVVY